jgi:hypothetical protein
MFCARDNFAVLADDSFYKWDQINFSAILCHSSVSSPNPLESETAGNRDGLGLAHAVESPCYDRSAHTSNQGRRYHNDLDGSLPGADHQWATFGSNRAAVSKSSATRLNSEILREV